MNTTDLTNALVANALKSSTKAPAAVDSVTLVLQKTDKKVQVQREAVAVELSSVGKLQSAFSQVQSASRALANPSPAVTSDADIAKAADKFVKAVNIAVRTTRSATTAKGGLIDNGHALAAEGGLLRAVAGDSQASSSLRQLGITQQSDGTLAIDAKKFDAALKANPEAVRSALADIGQQVNRTVTRELGNSGNVGSSLSLLQNRAKHLDDQAAAQQAVAGMAQQTTDTQTASRDDNPNRVNPGVAAYLRVFSA